MTGPEDRKIVVVVEEFDSTLSRAIMTAVIRDRALSEIDSADMGDLGTLVVKAVEDFIVGQLVYTVTEVNEVDYTVLAGDVIIFVTTGASDRTITIPDAGAQKGRTVHIVKVDVGVGRVEIVDDANKLVAGQTTFRLLSRFSAVHLSSRGTEWHHTASAGRLYSNLDVDGFMKHAAGVRGPYTTKDDTDYTATVKDETIVCIGPLTADRTITLPAPTSINAGKVYTVQKGDASEFQVRVDDAGGGSIAGLDPFILYGQFQSITVRDNGTTYDITSSQGIAGQDMFIGDDLTVGGEGNPNANAGISGFLAVGNGGAGVAGNPLVTEGDFIQTTNATPTIAQTFTFPAVSESRGIMIRWSAHQTGGASGTEADTATGTEYASFTRNAGGAARIVGALSNIIRDEDAAASAWAITVAVNGSNEIEISVTGEASKNINWSLATVLM